jgi:hypothetical protein
MVPLAHGERRETSLPAGTAPIWNFQGLRRQWEAKAVVVRLDLVSVKGLMPVSCAKLTASTTDTGSTPVGHLQLRAPAPSVGEVK